MRTIAVYFAPGNHRSRMIAKAMAQGIAARGARALLKGTNTYRGVQPDHDAAIFYGLAEGLARIFSDYARQRRAVYVDLGYWNRRLQSRHDGYHKLSLNARHPTAYFQRRPHPADRFERHRLEIKPWREGGRHILVAGMSAKGAVAERLKPYQWEARTIARLRSITDRPIVFRPKPTCPVRRAIEGAAYMPDQPLEDALRDCHAVVTHHSNVAVDALLAGVPVFCERGVASIMGGDGTASIERPLMPDGREQWAYDIAYTQYTPDEMRAGLAYDYLIAEGLIP